MNTQHKIDYTRPFANFYAEQRQCEGFWARLTTASRHAMVLYFSDATLSVAACERQAGVTNTTLRQALITRGLLPKSQRQPEKPHVESLSGAVGLLRAQLADIEAQQQTLNDEHHKVSTALNALNVLL